MKKTIVIVLSAILTLGGLLVVFMNLEPERRRPISLDPTPRQRTEAEKQEPPLTELPPEEWTPRILLLQARSDWERLDEELGRLKDREPQRFAAWDLGYLQARVRGEAGKADEALTMLAPYLAEGHGFRRWALYHASRFAGGSGDHATASRLRREVIAAGPKAAWWRDAIADEVVWLTSGGTTEALDEFAQSLRTGAPTDLRRDLDASRVEHRVAEGKIGEAWAIAIPLLQATVADDAADRVARALDTSKGLAGATPDRIRLLGETAQSHRHYDRAVALLGQARQNAPKDRADLTFSIGRSQFGAEQFADAERTYLEGAKIAPTTEQRSTFLFHASRCAQLLGDDERALRHLTAAIGAGGTRGGVGAALTQRMRTFMARGDWDAARRDFNQYNKLFPRSEVRTEAATHFAVGRVLAGDAADAERVLAGIPSRLVDQFARAEITYWQARAAEMRDPVTAVDRYLTLLRNSYPSHYDHLAQDRLGQERIAQEVRKRIVELDERSSAAVAAGEWEQARSALTDRWLLSRDPATLERLRETYRQLDGYREFVDLEPLSLPALGPNIAEADPARKVMAMGLYDDAVLDIPQIYRGGDRRSSLAQALALGRAGAGRESVLIMEIMMRRVPDRYVAEALPRPMLELLYPRYFWDSIRTESRRHGADPTLVISIMREESRFNPRAKSAAAARGLLQFIITTARSVGQSLGLLQLNPDDLYDPDLIIRLGAKYVGDLLGEFDGNGYRAAAAYNAGPAQTKLWNRLLPGSSDNDVFLAFVNFTETKNYVRKVQNSYRMYEYLYGDS